MDSLPDYEIKLLLDPSKVLDKSNDLTPALLNHFKIGPTPQQSTIQFLDAPSKDLSTSGWLVRMRREQSRCDKIEITYKKRYSIATKDTSSVTTASASGPIDAALRTATSDFCEQHHEHKLFAAQIEWGYTKQDLSIARDKSVSADAYPALSLPSEAESRKLIMDAAPEAFLSWRDLDWRGQKGWRGLLISKAKIYGPVHARLWSGNFKGVELDVEIWPVPKARGSEEMENVVEVSFKTKGAKEAEMDREELIGVLKRQGWLLLEDGMKTEMMLERY